jgi:hypothetical protein
VAESAPGDEHAQHSSASALERRKKCEPKKFVECIAAKLLMFGLRRLLSWASLTRVIRSERKSGVALGFRVEPALASLGAHLA